MAHGQAIAIGMAAAAEISNRMGILDESELMRLKHIIARADLPTEMPGLRVEEVIQVTRHAKKVLRDRLRFVLLKSIGEAFITDEVDAVLVKQVLSGE